ncbi:lysophospholipid acyltransferase family protein [Pelagicoccus mobilis]|uniref:Lysophospholipid acyltransferase family protein n=1 Tax=Pelagicoccus mobilis TaxID=415221 RepID=A0A934RYD0_9BACT|nr:lysophospholipid acyltransferase family protein [Pelagicoccus mobilis]MBK1877111.1 lysophospholipid acyltransferase family protein [Pelagicoccus mobilis]
MSADDSQQNVSRKTRITSWLMLELIKFLSFTYRYRIVGETEGLLKLVERGESVIITAWHNRLFTFSTYLYRFLLRNKFRLTLMTSVSKDGELGAIVGKYAGAKVVRGSSSRKGAAGLHGLYRALVKDKRSVIILPDGSKGPVYKAKVGVAGLAKMTGRPILPISFWASDCWRIRSWDRMFFPKPFARVMVSVGEFIEVPRKATEDDLEEVRDRVEKELDSLGAQATAPFEKPCICI